MLLQWMLLLREFMARTMDVPLVVGALIYRVSWCWNLRTQSYPIPSDWLTPLNDTNQSQLLQPEYTCYRPLSQMILQIVIKDT